MASEKLGSIKAVTTTKTLPANGTLPRFEVTVPSGSGTLAGVDIFKMMATYSAEMREDGTLYGECPNAGLFIAADVVATFRALALGPLQKMEELLSKGWSISKRQLPPLRA